MFKITIYAVVKKNLLNLALKAEFMKISIPQEKARCVSGFIETKSDVQAQGYFELKYKREQLARSTIRSWQKKSMEIGSVQQGKEVGRLQAPKQKI